MAVERVIGIDFGTSTSVVKVKTYRDGKPMDAREMSDYVRFDNKASLPTLVYKTTEGKYLIGYEAENAAVKGVLHQNFKLDLISASPEIRSEAVLYTQLFFEYLYNEYDSQKAYFPNCDSETTFISYPAKWSSELRDRMAGIACKAGFKNVKGLDEPTAAIHTVMVQESARLNLDSRNSANILMIDMGAGTTDLVLCEYTPYSDVKIRIINTWPKADSKYLFGGREIDDALCEYIKAYLGQCGLPNTNNFREKYLDKCKAWKENNVSPVLEDRNGVVRFCGFIDAILAMLGVDSEFPPLSRDRFEDMLSGYLSQFPKMINDCLNDAGFDKSLLDYVILTGGHSQWYFADEILNGTLTRFGDPGLSKIKSDGKRIIKLAIPQETVAAGLVYQKLNTAPSTPSPDIRNIQTDPVPNGHPVNTGNSDFNFQNSSRNSYPQNRTFTPEPPQRTEPAIRSVECKIAGLGANLAERIKGVRKENEASIYAVTGTLNIYGDRLEFDVDTHKHPTYSKNKSIVLSYALIRGIKKRYTRALTAEETMLAVIPYVAIGQLIAGGNKSILVEYNVDAEYVFTFNTKAEAEEMLLMIADLTSKCKGR